MMMKWKKATYAGVTINVYVDDTDKKEWIAKDRDGNVACFPAKPLLGPDGYWIFDAYQWKGLADSIGHVENLKDRYLLGRIPWNKSLRRLR